MHGSICGEDKYHKYATYLSQLEYNNYLINNMQAYPDESVQLLKEVLKLRPKTKSNGRKVFNNLLEKVLIYIHKEVLNIEERLQI